MVFKSFDYEWNPTKKNKASSRYYGPFLNDAPTATLPSTKELIYW